MTTIWRLPSLQAMPTLRHEVKLHQVKEPVLLNKMCQAPTPGPKSKLAAAHLAHAAEQCQQEAGLEQLLAVNRRRQRVCQVLELHAGHTLRVQATASCSGPA